MSEGCRFNTIEQHGFCVIHQQQVALCSHAADALRAERDKLQRYPFEPICLICGRITPCMTEADLKPGDPGVPCTFDPTPKQLFDENAALRVKVADLERQLTRTKDTLTRTQE